MSEAQALSAPPQRPALSAGGKKSSHDERQGAAWQAKQSGEAPTSVEGGASAADPAPLIRGGEPAKGDGKGDKTAAAAAIQRHHRRRSADKTARAAAAVSGGSSKPAGAAAANGVTGAVGQASGGSKTGEAVDAKSAFVLAAVASSGAGDDDGAAQAKELSNKTAAM